MRKARLDAPGTLHHVIVRGIEKRRIVRDDEDRRNFMNRLGVLAEKSETRIYAWSLMVNHAHLLLRSGSFGLPRFMRGLLTGYAVSYNRRHHRHGHLFQNRYHSIVCDEDTYFRELVRYIHLNPLRAGLVKSVGELGKYPWSGHAVVMGRISRGWQDREYVLSWFGKREGEARAAYAKYVEEGKAQGRRPELVGGGVVRSYGGWSAVLSLRRHQGEISGDERILGPGEFVEAVLKGAEGAIGGRLRPALRKQRIEAVLAEESQREAIDPEELRAGSRRRKIPRVRSECARRLVKEIGMSLAEAGRLLGVSTSAISKIFSRGAKSNSL